MITILEMACIWQMANIAMNCKAMFLAGHPIHLTPPRTAFVSRIVQRLA
ncbi:MAG: hypothetical protein HC915_00830 [Anaerolineae bacterium]|nr:hypothetical protein [Anaerolineae bacterium]